MRRKATMPSGVGGCESSSVSVRKIDNGFIINHSTMDGKGKYTSKEVFSPTKPKLNMDIVKGASSKDGASTRLKGK